VSQEEIIGVILQGIAALILVLLNGFFVAAEFALVKVRRTQLAEYVEQGNRRAIMAQHLADHLDAYLSAAQLGITLASLGLGWIGEPIFFALLAPVFDAMGLVEENHEGLRHSLSFGIGFGIITFLHIVVGEMAPKSLAIRQPVTTCMWVAYPFHWFYVAMKPFILALNASALWILRVTGMGAAGGHEPEHSEEELRLLVESANPTPGKRDLGRELILNAMDLRELVARDVIRPRQDIVVIDTEMPIEECLDFVTSKHFSRFPLCVGGDIDRAIGVVHVKDIYAHRNEAKTAGDLARRARKLIYIPETCRLEKLLELFMERKVHFAFVVDEFGGTEGSVTLENVLEELVGQIQDEFDEEKPLIEELTPTSWNLNGDYPLHELEELVDVEFEEEEIATTSGIVTHRLEGFPHVGDSIQVGEFTLTVLELDGTTVEKLRLELLPEMEEPPNEKQGSARGQ
jgi:CBS domain containing-hemolysin-like protein